MKKIMFISVVLLMFGITFAHADNDKPITVDQLPQKSQQFIKQHFPKEKVAFAKLERDFLETKYEVVFTNSSKVEFLKNGDWKEVDCKYSTVPVAIIPSQIMKYIKQNYPDVSVVQIDRDKRDYEVKLTNGLELTFDLKFNLIDIDD
ncbi:PepSY-like domain-containing protein [Coprobacter tertius]|uniref:PepSY-like domain-containing protein n=1 Tax=Coprobacter tertius TaxID=2944915 RepID=A0ABT1MJ38_9BACT|nr:PepSY-like domain-containing protein [Coprobacter tertius]MCP9611891.1 PepSY-like domain-containing protein [Coprobacter tertius]